jgi:hypothetical protein
VTQRISSAIWLRAELPAHIINALFFSAIAFALVIFSFSLPHRIELLFFGAGARTNLYHLRRGGLNSTAHRTLAIMQIVFQNDKDFPLVAVRVSDPRLILHRVAATGLHLVARCQPGDYPPVASFEPQP